MTPPSTPTPDGPDRPDATTSALRALDAEREARAVEGKSATLTIIQLQTALTEARAEIVALWAGADDTPPDSTQPVTPGRFIADLLAAPEQRRIAIAAHMLDDADQRVRCVEGNHEGRIARHSSLERRLTLAMEGLRRIVGYDGVPAETGVQARSIARAVLEELHQP